MVVQGRDLTRTDVGLIRDLMNENPDWGRSRLSVELCERWAWRNAQDRIKDMAAWKCADRDAFLGWECAARERNRQGLTNNTRFLVLPWVVVPHLAGHVLGLIARRIRADWQAKYGHPMHALETFVDRDRFKGTCYRAANWLRLGATRGRTRNDREHRIRATVKDVYLYPLVADFGRELYA